MIKTRSLVLKNSLDKNGIALCDFRTGDRIKGVKSIKITQDGNGIAVCNIEFFCDIRMKDGLLMYINNETK